MVCIHITCHCTGGAQRFKTVLRYVLFSFWIKFTPIFTSFIFNVVSDWGVFTVNKYSAMWKLPQVAKNSLSFLVMSFPRYCRVSSQCTSSIGNVKSSQGYNPICTTNQGTVF